MACFMAKVPVHCIHFSISEFKLKFYLKGTLHFENGAKYEATWSEGVAVEVS